LAHFSKGNKPYWPYVSGEETGGSVMWLQTGAYTHSSLFWLIAVIVIFVIALVALAVAGSASMRARTAMRGAGSSRGVGGGQGASGMGSQAPKPESHRMLDERYAKGEISREEYIQRQQDLQ
jgi:uncharacterized membrane protein